MVFEDYSDMVKTTLTVEVEIIPDCQQYQVSINPGHVFPKEIESYIDKTGTLDLS